MFSGSVWSSFLQRQLEDKDENGKPHKYRIIITTIQKLDNFITRSRGHEVYGKHIVIIFDECHRSQFGDMHEKIVKAFKNYHLFGFTGTPIFAKNAVKGKNLSMPTTPQVFGGEPNEKGEKVLPLHSYTIVDAINDGNSSVQSDWRQYVSEQEAADLAEIISTEKLKPEETRKFMKNPFRDGAIKTTGTDIDKLLPPVSRFGGGNRSKKKQGVIERLKAFFEKYFGLGIIDFS